MCCSARGLKSCNIAYVLFFLLISIFQIIVGACDYIFLITTNKKLTLATNNLLIPPMVIIILGLVILALCFLGCCGFIKEVLCCINVYSIFLVTIGVIQILNGSFALWNYSERCNAVTNDINDTLTNSMKWYTKEKQFMDTVQSMVHCCGVISPMDWKDPHNLPPSCCGLETGKCDVNSTDILYHTGCASKLGDVIVTLNSVVASTSISFGIVQFFGAIAGFCMGRYTY